MPGRKTTKKRRGPLTPAKRYLEKNHLSQRQAAEKLEMPYSVFRRVVKTGKAPNLHSAAKIVYGSGGAISFEDLLPRAERLALRDKYKNVLA